MLVRLCGLRFPERQGREVCEIFAESPGQLIARPAAGSLDVASLQRLLQQLGELKLPDVTCIRLDLSRVRELAGPWGVHFAVLIWASREMKLPIGLSGLRGQPAALAWLFRGSPGVRGLLKRTPVRQCARARSSDSRSAA